MPQAQLDLACCLLGTSRWERAAAGAAAMQARGEVEQSATQAAAALQPLAFQFQAMQVCRRVTHDSLVHK